MYAALEVIDGMLAVETAYCSRALSCDRQAGPPQLGVFAVRLNHLPLSGNSARVHAVGCGGNERWHARVERVHFTQFPWESSRTAISDQETHAATTFLDDGFIVGFRGIYISQFVVACRDNAYYSTTGRPHHYCKMGLNTTPFPEQSWIS